MKTLALLTLAFATIAPSAFARGGGSGWTGVSVQSVTTTTLVCADARGNKLRFEEKYEESIAGNSTKERHLARGEQGGTQNLDIRGELSADSVNLQILHYGTENYEDAKILGTLKGSLDSAVFEGSIPLAFQQTLAGPLSMKCEFSKK